VVLGANTPPLSFDVSTRAKNALQSKPSPPIKRPTVTFADQCALAEVDRRPSRARVQIVLNKLDDQVDQPHFAEELPYRGRAVHLIGWVTLTLRQQGLCSTHDQPPSGTESSSVLAKVAASHARASSLPHQRKADLISDDRLGAVGSARGRNGRSGRTLRLDRGFANGRNRRIPLKN
jgi:hypothetical protein